jgi:hypothetical protein
MAESRPKGCLAFIFGLFGIELRDPANVAHRLPYLRRDDFLSSAELSFYRALASGLGELAIICPKVNLGDIFFVGQSDKSQSYRNKIDRKHVDFLICDPATLQPRCGVELDDSSHARRDRQYRDQFVDQVFAAAGLPLVRIVAQATYRPADLRSQVTPHLSAKSTPLALPVMGDSQSPLCPKCGVPMQKRTAKQGRNAGQSFFGCPNYPRCKEILPLAL